MRVLRIIPSMDPKRGGPCQGIRNSIPELSRLGIANEVVCLNDSNEEFLKKDSFVNHSLGRSNGGWAYSAELEKWLIGHISEYEVIIIHGIWLYHSYITSKVIERLKKNGKNNVPKVYIMPHGMLDPWFQRDKSRKLKALRNEIYWRLIEKKVVNQADGLLFTCEQELLLARETFKGYKPKLELNIGYGIPEPPTFNIQMERAFQELGIISKDAPYWLFLSRIHPKKGIDMLIEAYSKLKEEGYSLPDLVIAGPLDSDYAQSMVKRAEANGQIHFTGMLQGDAKWGAVYGCDAFILPSHQENFGIAVVEALACRKLVLISDQVNIWREIAGFNQGDEGGLVAKDTSIDTYKLLKNLLSLTLLQKQRMNDNARMVYEKFFSVKEAVKKMASLILNA